MPCSIIMDSGSQSVASVLTTPSHQQLAAYLSRCHSATHSRATPEVHVTRENSYRTLASQPKMGLVSSSRLPHAEWPLTTRRGFARGSSSPCDGPTCFQGNGPSH